MGQFTDLGACCGLRHRGSVRAVSLRLSAALAAELSLSNVIAFSQTAWGRDHLPDDQSATHCAGLTAFWLRETIAGLSPLARLNRPTPDVVRDVAYEQAISIYPSFPDGYEPDERDRSRLAARYGSSDWQTLRREIEDNHQGEPVLYDLSRRFRYRAATVARFDDWSHVTDAIETPAPNTATLGVLRYRENGKPSGHRIAWFFDDSSVYRFFDPNIGEVTTRSPSVFSTWLDAFVYRTNYRSATPSGDPFLVTYSLTGVSSRSATTG